MSFVAKYPPASSGKYISRVFFDRRGVFYHWNWVYHGRWGWRVYYLFIHMVCSSFFVAKHRARDVRSRHFMLAVACLLVSAFVTPALALDPQKSITQFVHTSWT